MSKIVVIEITSEWLQKAVAILLGTICSGVAIGYLLSFLFPNRFSIAVVGDNAREISMNIVFSLVIFLFGLWVWWSTINYRCYVTDEGIGQTDGFRHIFVRWEEIAGYKMERIPNRRDRHIEPVLLDANARVIMRPMIPMFVYTRRGDEVRATFWRYITDRIDQIK